MYRGKATPSRDRRISPIVPRPSGPSVTCDRRPGDSARSRPSWDTRSARCSVSRIETGSRSSRRKQNSSTSAEGRSIHWASSTATSRGLALERLRNAPRTPRARTCRSGIDPRGVPRVSAPVTARLRYSGSRGRNSWAASPSRSSSAEKASGLSAEAGRQESTRKDGGSAVFTRYFHTTVLPIPVSPVMTSAAGSPGCPKEGHRSCPLRPLAQSVASPSFTPKSVVTRLPAYEKPALGAPMIREAAGTTRPAHDRAGGWYQWAGGGAGWSRAGSGPVTSRWPGSGGGRWTRSGR